MTKVLLWHWGRRGGGPKYTLELARALRDRGGLDVHMSLSEQSEILQELLALKLPMHLVKTYTGKLSAGLSLARLPLVRRGFLQFMRDHRIEVVVCTMSHLWNVAMLSAIRRSGARFMLALHDAVPHPGDNYLIRKWMLARELDATDGVLTLTNHVREQLCAVHDYPRNRTWIAPLGVFGYAASRSARIFPEHRPFRLLFFGRILPYKGLGILLEAFKSLEHEFPGIELSIVGSGDLAPYRSLLETLDNVIVKNNWVAEEDIGREFERSDLVVAPYVEASQSAVIATAFSAALPVVVTPVGGLVEQVRHLKDGYVATEPSAQAVGDAIRHFLRDPASYASCSQNALRQVSEALDWNIIGRQVAAAVEALAAMPHRRS